MHFKHSTKRETDSMYSRRAANRAFVAVVAQIDLRFVARVRCEKHGSIRSLLVTQWDEPKLREFTLAAVRDSDLSRALRNNVPFVRREDMDG